MRRVTTVSALLAAPILLGALATWDTRSPDIEVRPGQDLQEAVASTPSGATVRLHRGTHAGPVSIDRRITLEGRGATIAAWGDTDPAVTVRADGAVLRGIAVEGGFSGITVEGADRVVIDDVSVTRADLHGIEVVDATAEIREAKISDLASEYAQGIEVRNADGRGRTTVAESVVEGGLEGIVSHVAEVAFEDNTVTGTALRGIAITEMSEGVARGNTVSEGLGTGLYCGDMSRCEFAGNHVSGIAAGSGRFSAGWGLSVNYHATASTDGDVLAGAAGPVRTFVGSRIAADSPLELGMGAAALLPASAAVGAALVLLGLAYLVGRAFPRPSFDSSGGRSPLLPGLAVVVVAALVVQSFHMFEHFLQVYRVHFDGVPSRGGLAGPHVEAEWVHFIYNAAIVVLIAGIVAARAAGWLRSVKNVTSDRLLMAAGLIQSYHVVEHMAKLTQHLVTGHKVNPGILGRYVDLVWMHFTINLAVYAGFVGAVAIYAYGFLKNRERTGTREAVAARSG